MLFLDLEVYSDVSITEVPIDVYANHPSTRINLACAAFDDKAVVAWGEYQSVVYDEVEEFLEMLRTYKGPLNAWNVGFERTVLAAKGVSTPLSRWTDTMVLARQLGLPGSLKMCSQVEQLRMPAHAKTKSEKLLINKFCMPLRAKMKPGTLEEWAALVDYCRRDVESTRHIYKYVTANFPGDLANERRVWELDQIINERGLPIDMVTARHAAEEVTRLTGEARQKLVSLTGLANPNSVQQLLPWVKERGYIHDSLAKEFVQQSIDREGDRLSPECLEALSIRLSAAKSSVKKFAAIVEGTSPDNRLRHQFKYYGAHTGRWSGRGVQPQNLTRTPTDPQTLEELLLLRPSSSLDLLSNCVRPMIQAGPGKKLVVADLSAIENRGLMWLSGCDKGLAVFEAGRCPYKDFAVRFWRKQGLRYEDVTKQQRAFCKPAVLGAGYGLGAGQEKELANGQIALTGLRSYAKGFGVELAHEESVDMIYTFRTEFDDVPKYWRYLEQAFYAAVQTGKRQQVGAVYFGAVMNAAREIESVYAELPSGRRIHYMNPRAWQGAKGIEIRFDGLRNGQWWSITAWGGVICENVVQGFSRDVLVEGMMRAEAQGLPIVLHCHDELVAEVSHRYESAVGILETAMSSPIQWAPGCPLAAEGWEGERYAKV